MQVLVAQRQNAIPAGVVRIEDIPGRRVPFVLLMDIPIGNNTTSIREQSVTISQEGPFVAVKRMATFQSCSNSNIRTPVQDRLLVSAAVHLAVTVLFIVHGT